MKNKIFINTAANCVKQKLEQNKTKQNKTKQNRDVYTIKIEIQ